MLPSTFMTLRFGARLWMGSMAVVWGIISTCHALIRSKTGGWVQDTKQRQAPAPVCLSDAVWVSVLTLKLLLVICMHASHLRLNL